MSREIIRKRSIQQTILQTLNTIWEANPGVCLLTRHLYRGLGNSSVPPTQDEAAAALADLCERKLVAAKAAPTGEPLTKCYIITVTGRDFVMHDFPWDKIDQFSGGSG